MKPTLNQLSVVLCVPIARLKSKEVAGRPIEGVPYNSKDINWASVDRFIQNRIEKTGYNTVDEVYEAALKVNYEKKPSTRVGNPHKILFGTTPVRKCQVSIGDKIKEKSTGQIYQVIFATETITCYDTVDEFGNVLTKGIGNRVFNLRFDYYGK